MAAVEEEKKNDDVDESINKFPTRKVGTLEIVPLINGLWQVGNGSLHKNVSNEQLSHEMLKYSSVGLTTWDGADHYGPSETIMGLHREKISKKNEKENVYFTKWVPSTRKNEEVKYEITEAAIDKALKLMKRDSLDLLQFHWWVYQDQRYLKICQHFVELQKKGKIKNIALCNFNTENMKNIIENVKDIVIASNQVPYSIIDRRAENKMVKYCLENDIKLITYGTLLGGYLSNKWLGKKEPKKQDFDTASLQKYKKWIDSWSNNNWDLFQELLQTMDEIGKKYNSTIAQIALRYVMDKPAVGGVIIGCRLTVSNHIDETIKIFDIKLTDNDRRAIDVVVKKGRPLNGEPADEYRGYKL